MAATVGALRVTLGANTAQYEAGMRKAAATARTTGQSISRSFDAAHASVAKSFKGMAAGFAAGAIVTGFVGAAKSAFDYAASLSEVARQTGTTVEQYQILTRAALQNGVEQGILEGALKKLNITLGKAQGGAKDAVKAFANLGITKAQLDTFQRAGDALPFVAEGIRNLKTQSLQAAGAQAVMGKASGALLTILDQGKAGYDEMAKAAERAGLITQEQADRADEAKDKIDLLAFSLKTNLASALVDLIPDIENVISGFSGLISIINDVTSAANNMAPGLVSAIQNALGFAINPAGAVLKGFRKQGGDMGIGKRLPGGGVEIELGAATPAPGTRTLDLATGGGGGGRKRAGGAGNAAAAREKALRDAADVQRQLLDAQREELQSQLDLTDDTAERYNFQRQLLEIEDQQRIVDINLSAALKDIDAATAEQLTLSEGRVKQLKIDLLQQEEAKAVREEVYRLDGLDLSLQQDTLQARESLAQTAEERRKIELEALDVAYKQKQLEIDHLAASKDWADQEEARRRQVALPGQRALATQGVMQSTRGPLAAYIGSLPDTAAKANEALQQLEVQGIQGVIDGLVEMAGNWKNMGEIARRVIQSIISDLIRLQLQKIVAGAFGGSSSSGGFLGTLLGIAKIGASGVSGGSGGLSLPKFTGESLSVGALPHLAGGGNLRVGGFSGTDRNLLSLNGMPIARVSYGESIAVNPASNNNNGDTYHITANVSGDMSRSQSRRTAAQFAADLNREIANTKRRGY